jgi:hypothetical protein
MKAAQAAMAQAGGPPQGEEKGGPDGSALDAALQSGALQPAGAGGTSVEAAIQSGALMPAEGAMAQQPAGPSVDDLIASGAMLPAEAAEASRDGAYGAPMPGL